ncbi:MAG: B12-binding domain-containing radical SAM protein [bacterium]|nr:B12-binding domain-containing radical SAM protein [bacterium]
MKIVLIAAHQVSFSDTVNLYNCLGVLALASALKKENINCEVTDLEEFNNLYNLDFDEVMESIVNKVLSASPTILGLSTMSNNIPIALEICERIKKRDPKIYTILGGPGVSFCAEEVLSAFPRVDCIIRGEADRALPEFVHALESGNESPGNKGSVFRKGSSIVDNGWPDPIANLDDLPIPAYEFCKTLSTNEIKFGDYNGICVEAGRGCPFNCVFCSTSHFFKRKFRVKSVNRVIEEILYIREKTGNMRVIFNHDLLTLDHEYIEELCKQIKIHIPELVWKCHSRLDTINEGILEKMKEAGCNEIFFGIESVTERMQKSIKKNLDLSKFDETAIAMTRLGFRFSLSFIIGFPEETRADVEEIFKYAIRARFLCGDNVVIKIHTLAPLVGADLFNDWKDQLVYDEYGSRGSSDIPHSWIQLRDIIKKYPRIFSLYYYIKIDPAYRIKTLKYAMLGKAIEYLMKRSFRIACQAVEDLTAYTLVEHIDAIELPLPAPDKETDYSVLIDSIRLLVKEIPGMRPVLAKKYDAVAQYECAVTEILRHKSALVNKTIEVYYNPLEVITDLDNNETLDEENESSTLNCYLLAWDEDKNIIKIAEIPLSLLRN